MQDQISFVWFSPKEVSLARHQSQVENVSSVTGSGILHQIVPCVNFSQNLLSGVLATNDSIPETGNDTGLDLVNGEVGGNVVSALRDTGILGYQPHISLYIV